MFSELLQIYNKVTQRLNHISETSGCAACMEWPTLEPLTSEHDISILHASTTTSTLTLTLLVSLQKFLRRRTSQQSPM